MEPSNFSHQKWELLVSFLNASNSAVVITKGKSDDYAIVFANPAFQKLTGYDVSEVLGKNCRFLQNDHLDQPERAQIKACLENENHCECVIRNYTKSGEAFWNRITIFPFAMGYGDPNFVSIQKDASLERSLAENLKIKSLYEKRLIKEIHAKQIRLEQLSVDLVNAQEAERQAVARELHDELGQRLTALMMILDRVRSRQTSTDEGMLLIEAEEEVKYLIRLVRNMNASLRSTALALSGLEEAIRGLLRRQFSKGSTSFFDFSYSGPRLPFVVEITLFRIVQECLTNIIRHSRASHVVIRVVDLHKGRKVKLSILDDGAGFDSSNWYQANANSSKFGLIGINERVELLGGSLRIRSGVGRGTKIEVVIPVHAPIDI